MCVWRPRPTIQDELRVVALHNTSLLLSDHLLLGEDPVDFQAITIGGATASCDRECPAPVASTLPAAHPTPHPVLFPATTTTTLPEPLAIKRVDAFGKGLQMPTVFRVTATWQGVAPVRPVTPAHGSVCAQ